MDVADVEAEINFRAGGLRYGPKPRKYSSEMHFRRLSFRGDGLFI